MFIGLNANHNKFQSFTSTNINYYLQKKNACEKLITSNGQNEHLRSHLSFAMSFEF